MTLTRVGVGCHLAVANMEDGGSHLQLGRWVVSAQTARFSNRCIAQHPSAEYWAEGELPNAKDARACRLGPQQGSQTVPGAASLSLFPCSCAAALVVV